MTEIQQMRKVAMKTPCGIRKLFWIRILLKALILCIVAGIVVALHNA